MDSFHTLRLKARRLRHTVDATVLNGYLATRAIFAERDYEIHTLDPTDPLLAGAEAAVDHGVQCVYVRSDLADRDKAALVAHELGHLEVHGSNSKCVSLPIDVSEPEDPTPVGIQRVEGYSLQERRELQANVFAREFLLPRQMARTMFIDDGLRASQIAARLSLPLNVVRQQLFDCVLLPDPPDTMVKEAQPCTLDDSQRIAAEHSGSPLLLDAGPGTGKTNTLVNRIFHLVRSCGADPSQLLALTFSNKAALELSERIAELLPDQAPKIWTGTFHSFGLEILRKYHSYLNLPQEIRVMDKSDAIELLEDNLPVLGLIHFQNLYEPALELRTLVDAISRAKDELADSDTYLSLATAMRQKAIIADDIIEAERALEVAHVYQIYEQTLLEQEAVDFGDLIMRPTLLLEKQDAIRHLVHSQFAHILVDEYQDMNRASARFLRAITGKSTTLWVVGDARQSIYRFRGASSTNVRSFTQEFPGAERKPLNVNYRSTKEIVETFTSFSQLMKASEIALPLKLDAVRGKGSFRPTITAAPDYDNETGAIASQIRELEGKGVALKDQAVLCRANERLNNVAEALESRGIPVLHLGSVFERPEIRDLLSALSFLAEKRGPGLLRVSELPDYLIPLDDVLQFLRTASERNVAASDLLKTEALWPAEITGNGRAGLIRLQQELRGIERASMPWSALADYLLESSQYLRRLFNTGSLRNELKCVAIHQFLGFARLARTRPRRFPITVFLEQIRRLVLLAQERDLREVPPAALHLNAVKLMTIHGSKGLEFEAVHIPSLMTTGVPSSYRGNRFPIPDGLLAGPLGSTATVDSRGIHDEEEECLFFVAMSRARTHLHLYRSETAGKVNRRPSPFLDRIGMSIVENNQPHFAARLAPIDSGKIKMDGLPVPILDGAGVFELERCGRRFLYGHVLELPGFKRDTAFLKTHTCIYGVVDWLRQLEAGSVISDREMIEVLKKEWQAHGPRDHGLQDKYWDLAIRVVKNLALLQSGRAIAKSEEIVLNLSNGNILIHPDQVATLPNGTLLIRFFKTGRKTRSFKADETFHGLAQASAKSHYQGRTMSLEIAHLTDGQVTPIELSPKTMGSRLRDADDLLRAVRNGYFPAQPDVITCPRCPYFFICPSAGFRI